MDLAAAVLAGFVAAPLAPLVTRYSRALTGWVLALIPLLLAVYFTSRFTELGDGGEPITVQYAWAPQFELAFALRLDGLALLFALLICYVGAAVFVYSGSYLHPHWQQGRFFALLLMFMSSMLGVVLADNVLLLFVFWELTSLTSYMLIGFDHDKPSSRAAALQALLITGGGGLALLAGLVLLAQLGGTYQLTELHSRSAQLQQHALYFPSLVLILLGAFTKSAQFPFHSWLPAAMEAPTPVSAYLHSATMVKAGIYLLARISPILGGTWQWQWIVTAIGATTMAVGAWLSLHPTDLKRVLAYLTISALGMFTLLLGLGGQEPVKAALAYLVAHALYKGTLFLVAGAIDHATGTRDLRSLGGLGRIMPHLAAAAIIAALSLAGLPPLVGFVTKEVFYEAAIHDAPGLLTAAIVFSNMTFFAAAVVIGIRPWFGRRKSTPHEPHAPAFGMWIAPVLLAGFSLFWGLWPEVGLEPVVSAAATAVLDQQVEVHLPLWHGWTTALKLSLATFGGGVLIWLTRPALQWIWSRLGWFARSGPARWYEWGLDGLVALARWQTRWLQSGCLRDYFLIVLVTAIALPAAVLIANQAAAWPTRWRDIVPYEAALALLVVAAALMTTLLHSRLGAIAALGVVGYGVALIFVLFGAPDVAMTQFVVETLTVILFVLVFYRLPDSPNLSGRWVRLRDVAIALAVGCLMTVLTWTISGVQLHKSISDYYLRHSLPDAHGRNVVNVILVDFRALDTLGEITVLLVAGVGVYALLKLHLRPTPHQPSQPAVAASDATGKWSAAGGDQVSAERAGSGENA